MVRFDTPECRKYSLSIHKPIIEALTDYRSEFYAFSTHHDRFIEQR